MSYQSPPPKLSTLPDVKETSPADGDALTYVAADSKWENKPPSSGGLKFQALQYNGDGTNSKILSLNFQPKLIFIIDYTYGISMTVNIDSTTSSWLASDPFDSVTRGDENNGTTFALAFPASTEIDVGYIKTRFPTLGHQCNYNNDAYELFAFG